MLKSMAWSFLFFAMALSSCDKSVKSSGKSGGKEGREKPAAAVRVLQVTPRPIAKAVEVVSVLVGRKQADVFSRVNGKLSFIGAAEGARVREGEVLFRVDRSEPGESFLATPVTSPISGWIGRWVVNSMGAAVSAQQHIVTVVDDQILRASVPLPTAEWLQVAQSSKVSVIVGAETRTGEIKQIARSAEASSGRGSVTIEIKNDDQRWKSGMVAVVRFEVNPKPRIVVPASALTITDQGNFVFVVTDNKAARTKVTFLIFDNDQVEIIEGLSEGAQLIVEGVNQVGDASPVRIMDGPKEG